MSWPTTTWTIRATSMQRRRSATGGFTFARTATCTALARRSESATCRYGEAEEQPCGNAADEVGFGCVTGPDRRYLFRSSDPLAAGSAGAKAMRLGTRPTSYWGKTLGWLALPDGTTVDYFNEFSAAVDAQREMEGDPDAVPAML